MTDNEQLPNEKTAGSTASNETSSASPILKPKRIKAATSHDDPFARPENEDDDGYDPWSDRRPTPEPLFELDPWD